MKKELIGPDKLDKFLGPEDTVFKMGPDKILTPGAKDALRNRGIRIEYTQSTATAAPGTGTADGPDPQIKTMGSPEQIRNQTCLAMTIVEILDREYGITDPETLKNITLAVISQIDAN